MNALNWSWRHRRATSPVPAYLQQIRITGPVRFDPTLQTAGQIMQTRQVAGSPDLNGAVEKTGRLVPPERALDVRRQQAA